MDLAQHRCLGTGTSHAKLCRVANGAPQHRPFVLSRANPGALVYRSKTVPVVAPDNAAIDARLPFVPRSDRNVDNINSTDE